jgi:hypothetical protein
MSSGSTPAFAPAPDANLLASELLSFKRAQEAGSAESNPQLETSSSNLAALLASDGGLGSYDLNPAETHPLSGLNIAASQGEIASAGSRAL